MGGYSSRRWLCDEQSYPGNIRHILDYASHNTTLAAVVVDATS